MSLAQLILDSTITHPIGRRVQCSLAAPWEINHGLLRSPNAGCHVAAKAFECATRYTFADEVVTCAEESLRNSGSLEGLLAFARPPHKTTWFEWKHHGVHHGILVCCDQDMRQFQAILVQGRDGELVGLGVFEVDLSWRTDCRWVSLAPGDPAEPGYVGDEEYLGLAAARVFSLFLFLQTPNLTKISTVRFGDRLQRARLKRGRLPLVSMNEVKFAEPPALRTGEIRTRDSMNLMRWHKVRSHFRVYTKGRDEPLLTHVLEHYRGDPRLGVVLTNHLVGSSNSLSC